MDEPEARELTSPNHAAKGRNRWLRPADRLHKKQDRRHLRRPEASPRESDSTQRRHRSAPVSSALYERTESRRGPVGIAAKRSCRLAGQTQCRESEIE